MCLNIMRKMKNKTEIKSHNEIAKMSGSRTWFYKKKTFFFLIGAGAFSPIRHSETVFLYNEKKMAEFVLNMPEVRELMKLCKLEKVFI